jgi:hypothetical protein
MRHHLGGEQVERMQRVVKRHGAEEQIGEQVIDAELGNLPLDLGRLRAMPNYNTIGALKASVRCLASISARTASASTPSRQHRDIRLTPESRPGNGHRFALQSAGSRHARVVSQFISPR